MHCRSLIRLLSGSIKHLNQQKAVANISKGYFIGGINHSYSHTLQSRYHFSSYGQGGEEEVSQKTFSEFITDKTTLEKLKNSGFKHIFPIQEQTFNFVQEGRDVLASDRTGSGKTLAYTLPVLEKFHKAGYSPRNTNTPRFLILCPTRQLALQVTNEISKFNPGYRLATLYGGASIQGQIQQLQRGAAIVVATPGRLIDFIERKVIKLDDLEVVCIDEADTMLEKGFKLDVENIYESINKTVSKKTQNIMFSATIPPWVINIAKQYFTSNMKHINLIKDSDVKTSRTVDHFGMYVKKDERHQIVTNLIQRYNPDNRTIIFTQTKMEANEFIKFFENKEIVMLHGDIPQNTREHNINQFKQGKKKILIATDVAARGLDIPDVELIIQLSPPENPQPYIHRSGRTGRAGKEGLNITFFDESNIENLIAIEGQANIKIKIINNSSNITLWKNQLSKVIDKAISAKKSQDDALYSIFAQKILENNTPQEAIIYLLKDKIGISPKAVSNLTKEKGFITYKYTLKENEQPQKLEQLFPNIKFMHKVQEKDCIKFDVYVQESLNFDNYIEQSDLDIALCDESDFMSLREFKRQMKNGGFSSRGGSGGKYSDRNSRYGDDRGSRYRQDRGSRYNEDRSSNYREDRGSRYGEDRNSRYGEDRESNYGSDRYDRRSSHKEREETSSSGGDLKFFLTNFPEDITEEEMLSEINSQAGIGNSKLKIIRKTDDQGNRKMFAFLSVDNGEDGSKFLKSQINLKGGLLKKRISN